MRLTLTWKVLLLIAGPLAFQMVLLGALAGSHREHTAALAAAARSPELVASANRVLQLAVDAETGVRGYVLTGDPEFTERFDRAGRDLPGLVADLARLAGAEAGSGGAAWRIGRAAHDVLGWQAETERLFREGDRAAAVERIRQKGGKARVDALRAEVAAFEAAEGRWGTERAAHAEDARRRAGGVWLVGTAATFLLTGGLLTLFWRRTGRRFQTLVANTRRLAAGEALLPPVGGRDELAQMDWAFRDMATRLTAAAE